MDQAISTLDLDDLNAKQLRKLIKGMSIASKPHHEKSDEDKEKENLGHHLNKMIINKEIQYYKDNYDGLKNINKRLMNETLEQLQYNTDNPNTLLGKLCIRMTALDMFEDWDANDFPNIPSYE